jgi:hypothetical protein
MRTKRLRNWPKLLAAHLKASAGRPFAWGAVDCGLAAADAIQAMTGKDPAAELRGRYSTADGATEALLAFAGGGIEAAAEKIAAQQGWSEIPIKFAGRGDLVLFDSQDGATLGIVGMDGIHAHSTGPKGAVRIPILGCCRRAWRV